MMDKKQIIRDLKEIKGSVNKIESGTDFMFLNDLEARELDGINHKIDKIIEEINE